MSMTPEAKTELRKIIRGTQGSSNGGLRQRLLDGLQTETERIYRLAIKDINKAGLKEAEAAKRRRLQDWLEDQVRMDKGSGKRKADVFLKQAVKQAAYTLLNRLAILRLMEGMGLRRPFVLTGGRNSPGYRDFRALGAAIARDESDRSEGYAFLLQLIFEELATDLPGLYGSAGIADLIPVPSELLKAVIEGFDDPQLKSCWSDDMTLGWIYQFWNDPDREEIDKKLSNSGKVEPHEIASKTQMFTERYMVDWLLQNSLGPMWLSMCRKHGWTPDCEADGTLQTLEERRVDWRAKRDERQAALAARTAPIAGSQSARLPAISTDDEPVEESLVEYETETEAETDSSDEVMASQEILRDLPDPSGEQDDDSLPGVSLTALMPLYTDEERRWAYYVPQPIPEDAILHAPETVRDLKILDPAVGSGHFLVVAFDLLFALYQEEARHRGEVAQDEWTDAAIVERILEHNLYGIDLDPRAVQIAAAALWLKSQKVCPAAQPKQLNLVASNLGITALADDDPALVELRKAVEEETGIPGTLTNQIIEALRGAEHLGSLLKVDKAIADAIQSFEDSLGIIDKVDRVLFNDKGEMVIHSGGLDKTATEEGILSALEDFLSRHTSAQELGLRLAGEQLAAGVRFVRMVKEGTYDLVVANPPYQGTSKMSQCNYIEEHYSLGKADLFSAFLLRGLELTKDRGVSAMLTMRIWMFTKLYEELRSSLFQHFDIRAIGDFAVGAFDEVANDILSVATAVFHNVLPRADKSLGFQPTTPTDLAFDRLRTQRKRAATLCHRRLFEFDPNRLRKVDGWPLIYWWTEEFIDQYSHAPKLGDAAPVRMGLSTSDNTRFLRYSWEIRHGRISDWDNDFLTYELEGWRPLVSGADGVSWITPLQQLISWRSDGLGLRTFSASVFRNPTVHMNGGVAFTPMGNLFSGRAHRYRSIFDAPGRSVVGGCVGEILANMNSTVGRRVMEALNPSISFTVNDVERLPLFHQSEAEKVYSDLKRRFALHEAHREASVEFVRPGPSPWNSAKEWAQRAVDRPDGEPLRECIEQLDPEPPTDHLSFAAGVALGRFGRSAEGILDPETADLSHALPHGILFLDGTLDDNDLRDGLGHTASKIIHDKWATYGSEISPNMGLRQWLRTKFFPDVHKAMYENRPIHWPLTSANKTFVAWINIHRWNARTLTHLLAMLQNTFRRIEGELNDMRKAADGKDATAARSARDNIDDTRAAKDELETFIALVQQCADKGPPSPEVAPGKEQCPAREVDAPYDPNLDDGVMINSAALWPLLDPVWKDPKKWWDELCRANPQGNKDYDWSHLAMEYWPRRVDKKCQTDPSLAVAHGCFWKYHPANAWKWELRLQDEIGPDFRIEEAPYTPFSPSGEKVAEGRMRGRVAESQTPHPSPLPLKGRGDNTGGDAEYRTTYLAAQPQEALDAVEKELTRRRGKGDDIKTVSEMTLLESGLWTALPEVCWEIEAKFIKKQKAGFRLLAPDEAVARKALLKADPALKKSRRELLAKIAPHDPFAAVGVMGEES